MRTCWDVDSIRHIDICYWSISLVDVLAWLNQKNSETTGAKGKPLEVAIGIPGPKKENINWWICCNSLLLKPAVPGPQVYQEIFLCIGILVGVGPEGGADAEG